MCEINAKFSPAALETVGVNHPKGWAVLLAFPGCSQVFQGRDVGCSEPASSVVLPCIKHLCFLSCLSVTAQFRCHPDQCAQNTVKTALHIKKKIKKINLLVHPSSLDLHSSKTSSFIFPPKPLLGFNPFHLISGNQ